MKKMLALLMALVMVLGMMPTAWATTGGTPVAKIGEQTFDTLEAAIAYEVEDDTKTIVLLSDVERDTTITLDKEMTFDLNGYSVSSASNAFAITADVTMKNSSSQPSVIACTSERSIQVYNNAKLYIEDDITINGGAYGVLVFTGSAVEIGKDVKVSVSGSGIYLMGATAVVNGTVTSTAKRGVQVLSGSKLTVNSTGIVSGPIGIYVQGNGTTGSAVANIYGTVNGATDCAVMGNGTNNANNNYSGTAINIYDGAKLESPNTAIYQPQDGVLSIYGGEIEGGVTGIEIRAGQMTVKSGTIIGNGVPLDVQPNGSGTTTDGAGVAVAQHTTTLPLNVLIEGGTIKGFSALYESNPQNNPGAGQDVTMSITNGEFVAINGGTQAVHSIDCEKFITGGTFSSNPADYVADGYLATESNGKYTVAVKSAENCVAKVGEEFYPTLVEAVAAANEGETVTLLKDIAVPNVNNFTQNNDTWLKITKANMVLDGNGYKIDASGATFSAISSVSNYKHSSIIGVEANNVTIKNLTVIGTSGTNGVGHGINVYQKTGVVLDKVTVKNCAAGVVFNGSTGTATNLTTSGNTWYGVNVDKGTAQLTINSANLSDTTALLVGDTEGSAATVIIKGGTFSTDPTAYLAEGYFVAESNGVFTVHPAADAVAAADGEYYLTLADAFAAGGNVVVLKNAALTERPVVAEGQAVTLDLAGYTVTLPTGKDSEGKDVARAILNEGTLTVKDSAATGKIVSDKAVFQNLGTLTVDSGHFVAGNNNSGSVINNGFDPGKDPVTAAEAYVNGGVFEGALPIFNFGTTTVTDGIFKGLDAANVIDNKAGKLDISGGTFNVGEIANAQGATIEISGGTYSIDPRDYLAAGYGVDKVSDTEYVVGQFTAKIGEKRYTTLADAATAAQADETILMLANDATTVVALDEGVKLDTSGFDLAETPTAPTNFVAVKVGNIWTVIAKPAAETDAKPATADPAVTVATTIPADKHEDVKNVAETVTAEGLADLAVKEAAKITQAEVKAAEAALKQEIDVDTGEEIHTYAQTYFDITPTGYDATTKMLTMDITPMVQTVASTAEIAENIKLEGMDKNAVVLFGSQEKLDVDLMDISLILPKNFFSAEPITQLFVQHLGHEYPATVTANIDNYDVSFTTRGFSPFTFTVDSQAVAYNSSTDVYYTSLVQAVKEVADNETIVLQANNTEDVSVSRTVTFTLENATWTAKPITAGYRTSVTTTPDGTKTTYAFVRRAGGGGGSYRPSGHLVTSTLNGIEQVYVDGVLVNSKNYTVSGGDVTLKQSYIDSLKAGTHTVKLIYGDRQATGTFTTKGTGKVESAKTFDAGIVLYAGMALSSAMGAAYVMKKKH